MRIGCHIGMWKGPAPAAEKLAAVATTGAAGVELFTADLASWPDGAALRAALEARGLALSGAYFRRAGWSDPAAEADVLAEVDAACRTLAAAGGELLVLDGGPPRSGRPGHFTDADFARLARLAGRIADRAAAAGVELALHPHWRCQVETPEDFERLLAAGLDPQRVGLCIHAVHQYLAGADPYALVERYAPAVRCVHAGDSDADRRAAVLGAGVLDHRRLFEPLRQAGFDGWVVIEGTVENLPPEQCARRGIAYLRSVRPGADRED